VALWMVVGSSVDMVITGKPAWVPVLLPFLSWVLLMAYPAPLNTSPAFTETAMVGGFATGKQAALVSWREDVPECGGENVNHKR
jgi:hypothetical protein